MKLLIVPVILVLAACSSSDDNNRSPTNNDSGNTVTAPDVTNPDDTQSPDVTPAPADAPNPDDDPVTTGLFLNRDNHVEVLAHVFDVISGRALTPSIIDIPTNPELYATFVSEFVPESDFPEGNLRTGTIYSCGNGGTVTQVFLEDTGNIFRELSFDNCLADGLVLHGDMAFDSPARSSRHYSALSITLATDMQTTVDISGSVDTDTRRSLFDEYTTRSTFQFDYTRVTTDGVLQVSNSQTDLWYGKELTSNSFNASLEATFDLASAELSGRSLVVETPQPFSFASDNMLSDDAFNIIASTWNFSTGQLSIITGDESSLLLDANTGDDSTVSITIRNNSGEEVFQQPWSLWRDNLAIDLPQVIAAQPGITLAVN
jgi:hypothetical protein